jgi:DNA repair protein RecO (recombination protein O)
MGEADRRLTFFTESAGAVTVVAKSAHRSRKRFGGVLQKYFLLDLSWSEEQRRLPILTSASILEAFWDILANWERVRYADYLLELVSAFFPQAGPKPKAFTFLLAGIRSLSAGESPVSVGRKMEAAFLAAGGWGPDLSACGLFSPKGDSTAKPVQGNGAAFSPSERSGPCGPSRHRLPPQSGGFAFQKKYWWNYRMLCQNTSSGTLGRPSGV